MSTRVNLYKHIGEIINQAIKRMAEVSGRFSGFICALFGFLLLAGAVNIDIVAWVAWVCIAMGLMTIAHNMWEYGLKEMLQGFLKAIKTVYSVYASRKVNYSDQLAKGVLDGTNLNR